METKIYILTFLVVVAFFMLCLLTLRRLAGWLGRFMVSFWTNTGVLGAKDGKVNNARINGFVYVGSVLFLLLGMFAIVALGGYQYAQFKFYALVFAVVLLAPPLAKWLGRRKQK